MLAFGPLVAPAILLAIGIYDVELRVGLDGTIVGLVLAHTVMAFPIAFAACIPRGEQCRYKSDVSYCHNTGCKHSGVSQPDRTDSERKSEPIATGFKRAKDSA